MSLIFRAGVDPIRYPQLQALSNCQVAAGQYSGSATTTSSSFANTQAAASVSFTKYDAASRLRVDVHTALSSATAAADAEFAILINSTDYVVTNAVLTNITVHKQCSGVVFVSGIAAGAHTATLRWRRTAGSGTLTVSSAYSFSIAVSECQE